MGGFSPTGPGSRNRLDENATPRRAEFNLVGDSSFLKEEFGQADTTRVSNANDASLHRVTLECVTAGIS
jgi:hypothetical protein